MIRFTRALALGAALLAALQPAMSTPTSGQVKVKNVRPYNAQGSAGLFYVTVDSAVFCSTDTFAIDLSWGGAKEMVATVMSATMSGSYLLLEASNVTGCKGWGTVLQSVTLIK